MTTTTILSDNGASSGSAGIKTTGGNDGTLQLQTTTSGGTATTALTIDTSQNVGIGTSSPAYKLDVKAASSAVALNVDTTVLNADTPSAIRLLSAGGTGIRLLPFNGTGRFNWQIAAQTNVNNALEITPSTASGGSTFSNPAVVIDSSGNVGIGTSSPGAKLDAQGTTPAYFGSDSLSGTRIGYAAALPTNSVNCFVGWIPDTVGPNGVNGDLALQPRTSAGANIRFFTGSTSASERARIDSSGNLLVGTTSSGGVGYSLTVDAAGRTAISNTTFGGGFTHSSFRYNGTQVGAITTSTTATTYATSSDYRLKENIAPMTGALAKVAALKPCTYTWKYDGSSGEGFIAHELQAVVPQCVTGEKDAVDADGNPVYQGIDTSFLVATLTAAIQEQQALIQQLQADVAALQGEQA